MAAMTTFAGIGGRMRALGVVVFPLAAALLVGYGMYGHAKATGTIGLALAVARMAGPAGLRHAGTGSLAGHVLVAQERALRRREFHLWLRALPPLTALETLLFRTIVVGFTLLTATLLTGVLFVDQPAGPAPCA